MDHHWTAGFVLFSFIALSLALGVIIFSGGKSSGSFFSPGLTGAVVAEPAAESTAGEASCTGRACTIACYSDQDCSDHIAATQDLCRNAGTSESLCVNVPRE